MKINLSDFFPDRNSEDKEQEEYLAKGNTFDSPPQDLHQKLAAATKAKLSLLEIRSGKKKPSSLEVIVTLFGELLGTSPFSFSRRIGVPSDLWKEILLHRRTPDHLSPTSICDLSKVFSIPFSAWKEALIGSFVLCKTGGAQTSLARSSKPDENTGSKRIDAGQELLIKAAGKNVPRLSSEMEKFLREVEACMKQK